MAEAHLADVEGQDREEDDESSDPHHIGVNGPGYDHGERNAERRNFLGQRRHGYRVAFTQASSNGGAGEGTNDRPKRETSG